MSLIVNCCRTSKRLILTVFENLFYHLTALGIEASMGRLLLCMMLLERELVLARESLQIHDNIAHFPISLLGIVGASIPNSECCNNVLSFISKDKKSVLAEQSAT